MRWKNYWRDEEDERLGSRALGMGAKYLPGENFPLTKFSRFPPYHHIKKF